MGLGNGVEDKGEDGDGWVWLVAGWAGKQNGEEDQYLFLFDLFDFALLGLLLIIRGFWAG